VKRPRILAISGSLRARSSNTELLRAVSSVADPFADVVVFQGIGDLPHFNPDLDEQGAELPDSVKKFRAAIGAADAVLISSPEYAHGIPGSLKNALDWLVSGPEMPGKSVGLLNASARSVHAHAALQETLRTMSTNLVPEAVAVVPLDGRRLDAASIAADSSLAEIIRNAVEALLAVTCR
jgi:chromate reductase